MKKLTVAILVMVMVVFVSTLTSEAHPLKGENSVLPEEMGWKYDSGVSETSEMRKEFSLFNLFSVKSNRITCNSSLKSYNDNTRIWAYSYTENGYMDDIYTYCIAYWDSGREIGHDECRINYGQVYACSAFVDVDTRVFPNLKAGSAKSQHTYARAKYDSVNHSLSWKR